MQESINDFEKNRTKTFILIDGFKKNSEQSISLTKGFLGYLHRLSDKNVITFALNVDCMKKYKDLSFPLKLNLNKEFLEDEKLGYKTLIEELPSINKVGKNLLRKI